MSWQGHKGTFRCPEHPKLTVRARRWRIFNVANTPKCRTCGKPMVCETLHRVREYGRVRLKAFRHETRASQ